MAYIQFEGTSYVGKSTQAKQIEMYLKNKGLQAKYNKSCPSEDSTTSELIKKVNKLSNQLPKEIVESAYLLDFLTDHTHIQTKLEKGVHVIQDRGLSSYKVFTDIYRDKKTKRIINTLLNKFKMHIPTPDIVFYLTTNQEEKLKRALEREKNGISEYDQKEIYDKKFYETLETKMAKELEKFPNVYKIDTTNRSIKSITEEVINQLNKSKII